MKYQLDFDTSYSQFYVYDKDSPDLRSSANFWTHEAYEDRLAIENGVLGIGTECYGHVKAELEILQSVNNLIDFTDFDHIVEAGIEIKSGIFKSSNVQIRLFRLSCVLRPELIKLGYIHLTSILFMAKEIITMMKTAMTVIE
jgi:hypothetical protein